MYLFCLARPGFIFAEVSGRLGYCTVIEARNNRIVGRLQDQCFFPDTLKSQIFNVILIKIWMILGPQESSRFCGKCLSQTEFHRCCISGNFRNSQIFSSFMSPDETSLFLRSKFTIVTMHPLGIGHESLHYCIRLDFIFCFKLSRKSLSGIDSNGVRSPCRLYHHQFYCGLALVL